MRDFFFDPRDTASIADTILAFLQDDALAGRLRAAALPRSRDFSWETAAELSEACFRRALGR